jgi:hypothetical protein
MKELEGSGLGKLLLSYEKGMKKRPKYEGKNKRSDTTPKGLRLRKTVRGKVISPSITQINLKVLKEGKKSLKAIFEPAEETPAEEKPAEPVKEEAPKAEEKKETPKVEEKKEEKPKEEAPKEEKPAENSE